jgi:hypothetical protein
MDSSPRTLRGARLNITYEQPVHRPKFVAPLGGAFDPPTAPLGAGRRGPWFGYGRAQVQSVSWWSLRRKSWL